MKVVCNTETLVNQLRANQGFTCVTNEWGALVLCRAWAIVFPNDTDIPDIIPGAYSIDTGSDNVINYVGLEKAYNYVKKKQKPASQ